MIDSYNLVEKCKRYNETETYISSSEKIELLQFCVYRENDDDYFVVRYLDAYFAVVFSSEYRDDVRLHCVLRFNAHAKLRDAIKQVRDVYQIDVLDTLADDEASFASQYQDLCDTSEATVYLVDELSKRAAYLCDKDSHAIVYLQANCKYRAFVFVSSRSEYMRAIVNVECNYLTDAIVALADAKRSRLSDDTLVELHDFDLSADYFDFTISHKDVLCCVARFDYMTKQVTMRDLDLSQFEIARCDARAIVNDAEFLSVCLAHASAQAFDQCE